MMRLLTFLLLHIVLIETAVAINEGRTILVKGGHACEGYVKVYHENEWGYVGDTLWRPETERVVCRSTFCGEPVENSTVEDFLPAGAVVSLNEIVCGGKETNLLKCNYPGWNISKYRKRTVKKVKCSRQIQLGLDGFTCAGYAKYSTPGMEPGYFCSDKWGKKEADKLCKDLNCGTYKTVPNDLWIPSNEHKGKKMQVQCSGDEEYLWQCVVEQQRCGTNALVVCSEHKRIQLRGEASNVCSGRLEIQDEDSNWKTAVGLTPQPHAWCRQMGCGTNISLSQNDSINLTCSDQVKVLLKDTDQSVSHCYGFVYIQVNGNQPQPVCSKVWNKENAEMVCKELNCGAVVDFPEKRVKASGILDNVRCAGGESSLWHCMAKRSDKPIPCSKLAYVVCSGSFSVQLVDGPGICSGKVEIKEEGKWKAVSLSGWSTTNSNKVCNFLNCGNAMSPTNPEIYNKKSPIFMVNRVNCEPLATHISQCITQIPTSEVKEAVGITCEGHQVLFLEGTESCVGVVGIEQNQKTYWLSGSAATWNKTEADDACKQMHCGSATKFESLQKKESIKKDSIVSKDCLNPQTSIYDCNNTTALLSDHHITTAMVTCSGKIKVNLTDDCWGKVNICTEGTCGGVCSHTWTDRKSKMLCKHLNCGDEIFKPLNQPTPSGMMFKSVHVSSLTGRFNRLSFVTDDQNTCEKAAHIVCSGSIKYKFFSKDKCFGNVKVRYEGQWLSICKEALKTTQVQDTICGELGCGRRFQVLDYFGPKPTGPAIKSIDCLAKNKSLNTCKIETQTQTTCLLGAVKCFDWAKIELEMVPEQACSGNVYVNSEKNPHIPVSAENWSKAKGERLCKDLNCGNYQSMTKMGSRLSNFSFNCDGKKPESIWDCEKQESFTPAGQLSIQCEALNVSLSGECHGIVKIDGREICANNWNNDYSHLICQEKNCSNAVHETYGNALNGQFAQHVSCDKHEHRLAHCDRDEGKCDKGPVSVYCVKNVKFKVAGNCGGQIEVSFDDMKYENICSPTSLSAEHKNSLCKLLNCTAHDASFQSTGKHQTTNKVKLFRKLNCKKEHRDIRHCVTASTCEDSVPEEIYCHGYKPEVKEEKQDFVKPGLIGFGVLLIVILLVAVLVMLKMGTFPKMMASLKKKKKKNVEEADDFNELGSKANEMEIFGHENEASDAGSVSSQYEEVPEMDKIQPLTAADNTTSIPLQNPDVAYELDESELDYDDVAEVPKVTETQAEVHNSSQYNPEEEDAGMAQWEDDYLVPNQE